MNIVTDGLTAAIITPDKDIIPGASKLEPAYLVFNNYELILKFKIFAICFSCLHIKG